MPPERYPCTSVRCMASGRRSSAQRQAKDLTQAATLIDYLSQHDPAALQDAWNNLNNRGPGWRKRAAQGLDALQRAWPDLDVSSLES